MSDERAAIDALRARLLAERDACVAEKLRLETGMTHARDALRQAKRLAPSRNVPQARWSQLLDNMAAFKPRLQDVSKRLADLNTQIRQLQHRAQRAARIGAKHGASWYFMRHARRLLAARLFDTILREALEEMAAVEGVPVDMPPEPEE